MTREKQGRTHRMVACAVMAAVICALGPQSIPIEPVPISLATLAIYLTVCLLGWKWGTVSTVVYLILGFAGVPVFAGYTGGLGKLAGPTGGYLVGYIPLALVAGLAIELACRHLMGKGTARTVLGLALQFAGMAAGTAVLYAFGTAWYCILSGNELSVAVGFCVIPFISGDLVKMVAALVIAAPVRARLEKARLL